MEDLDVLFELAMPPQEIQERFKTLFGREMTEAERRIFLLPPSEKKEPLKQHDEI